MTTPITPCFFFLSFFLVGVYSSESIIHRCASALRLLCLCHAAPPTAVGGAHNSPIANATTILESGLVRYRLHNPSGVFYFPWHRHQTGPTIALSEKTRAISGKVGTQARVTDRPGFDLTTLGSSVRLATIPPRRSAGA